MLRLNCVAALTIVTLAIAALVADLVSARAASRFGVLYPVAATSATTVGAVKTQRLLGQAQQSRSAIGNAAKTTGSAAGGIVRNCPPC
jgi:hypothetical protein